MWLAVCLWPVAIFVPHYLLAGGHHPPVGTYIAIMGGLAAAVTLREKPSLPEKAAWIFLIALVMVAEIRNLYIADAEEAAKFDTIGKGLDATKRGLDGTVAALNAAADSLSGISDEITSAATKSQQGFSSTMAKVADVINTETGGNSFCYLDFEPIATPIPPNFTTVVAVRIGKYPVREVHALLFDAGIQLNRWRELENEAIKNNDINSDKPMLESDHAGDRRIDIGSFATPDKIMGSYPLPSATGIYDGKRQHLTIIFRSFNAEWTEEFRMREINGKWVRAIRVLGMMGAIHFEKVDPDFPRVNGKVQWDENF